MGEKIDMETLPSVEYDDISKAYAAKGIDIRDLMRSEGHFRKWCRKHGEDENDRDAFQRYQGAPDGEDACPPYVDFWHWLLKAYDSFPWQEETGSRHKLVPLTMAMFVPSVEITEEEIAAGRRRLEERMGESISDEMWKPLARDARQGPVRHERSLKIAGQIIEEHGRDIGAPFGRTVMMHMRVST